MPLPWPFPSRCKVLRHSRGALALLATAVCFLLTGAARGETPRLTFAQLILLSQPAPLESSLQSTLQRVLTIPVVSNRTNAPASPNSNLRVTEWNIERGENLDDIEQVLRQPDRFMDRAQQQRKLKPAAVLKLRAQAEALRRSDVLILNEVDIGVKRTDYRNAVHELADLLGFSSAYAVEFVEVDGLSDLGTQSAVLDTPELSARMTADLQPDRDRYQGLHVNAILSRYPLQNVHTIELPICHDWFLQEQQEISLLEKAKRRAANLVFLERIERELRRGNRNALVADISLPGERPGAPPVRIVNVHLENKCKAGCRVRQMDKVLEEVGDSRGAVILGGDLNTTGTDGTPTSVRYELSTRVQDYQFWINTLLHFSPVSLPVYATAPFGFWKNFRDPTALHIPLIGNNPEARLFVTLRKYQFADDGTFDFRGLASRNRQKSTRTLSDSNQRARKGFVPTFRMKRDFGGVNQYRLDWLFVKPSQGSARSLTFQPEMPQTLGDLNNALPEKLSDHAPITLELQMPILRNDRP